jgi:putative ABC transport system ATP-binding protein
MALIQAVNLEKTYYNDGTATPALHGVSFNIDPGEFVAIMGPSGSGKSTLLHILGFLDEPTRGKHLFEDKTKNDFSKKAVAQIRNQKMGFVFQAFNLLPQVSAFENIKLPLFYSQVPENQWDRLALRAIELVELSHRKNYQVSRLSGGERQRVAIARALVNDPQVILADEPTGNLDSKSGKLIMEYIKKLHQTGRTIIVITHESYIASYAKRIIELKDGQIKSDQKT